MKVDHKKKNQGSTCGTDLKSCKSEAVKPAGGACKRGSNETDREKRGKKNARIVGTNREKRKLREIKRYALTSQRGPQVTTKRANRRTADQSRGLKLEKEGAHTVTPQTA